MTDKPTSNEEQGRFLDTKPETMPHPAVRITRLLAVIALGVLGVVFWDVIATSVMTVVIYMFIIFTLIYYAFVVGILD